MKIYSCTQAKIGQEGIAHWTNSYNLYKAKAKIVKINLATIRVELLETINGYPEGKILVIPLGFNQCYSENNCFETI